MSFGWLADIDKRLNESVGQSFGALLVYQT